MDKLMQILLASLCDFAADYHGKLCVSGAFDSIFSRQFPAAHPQCSVAVRIMVTEADVGSHTLQIRFINPDGKSLVPEEQSPNIQFQVKRLPENSFFFSQNFVCNFQRLPLPAPGQYEIRVMIDSEIVSTLPLQFLELPQSPPPLHGGTK